MADLDFLLRLLKPGVTVVTANRRLARVLHQAEAERRRGAGEAVWEMPDILPWNAWLARCWEGLLGSDGDRLLLGPLQEQALWERVISESGDADAGLLQVSQAARLAAAAWSLMHAWRVDLGREAQAEEVEAFRRWSDAYEGRCRREGWTDNARLPDLLIERLEHRPDRLPESFMLFGFEELTPQQQHLLERLDTSGCPVSLPEPPDGPASPRRHLCTDAEAEVSACACWARQTLEARSGTRIGVVVPDLAAQRGRIERLFEDMLHPAALLPGVTTRRAFNLSLGRPLAEQPLVHAAFLVLDLVDGPLEMERVGQLLRSPFLGEGLAEAGPRARLDARLRDSGELRVTPERLLQQARGGCPALAARLEDALALLRSGGGARPAGAWAEHFTGLLQRLGWPGERSLDSAEYQATQAWRKLLETFATLALVQPRLGARAALARLRRLGGETPFQPEAEEAPIQVLGLLEASGLRFDALWVMGLHDEIWPPPARPNPFLPAALQRRLGLPHASAERELAYAAQLTRRLAAHAEEVHFSSPAQEGDRLLRPSPLIASLPLEAVPAAGPGFAEQIHEARVLVPGGADVAPPLREGVAVHGGARLLQLQAACPFRAFAELRLGAQPLGSPAAGLDALDRGSLLHRVLESLWRELGNQHALRSLSEEALEERLADHAEAAVAELARVHPQTATRAFRELERVRLVRLLREWLALEAARPPFTVTEVEGRREATLGGLTFQLRVDRVDRLADGATLLIDYKTGQPKLGGWFGERPDEPQLPLYAVTETEPVEALLYGRVRAGECAFLGLSREADRLPGVAAYDASRQAALGEPDWDAQVASWHTVLADLAAHYRAGDARVDPKQRDTCTFCHLQPLCRIHDLATAAEEGSGDE